MGPRIIYDDVEYMNDYGELATKRVPRTSAPLTVDRRAPTPLTVDLTAPNLTTVGLSIPNPNPNPDPNPNTDTSMVPISSVLSLEEIVRRKFLDAEKKGLMITLE